jgi:hypothetical protein
MITPAFCLTATERVLPKLALDFTTASLDPRVTFTRALNTATRVNSSGYVEIVNADLPRFDYDPITLFCKGLLIEESRTNIAQNSEAINLWGIANVNITSNAQTSPANTLTAESVSSGTGGASIGHYVSAQGFSPSASTTYTASCFFKPLTNAQYIFISLRGASGNYGGATFDLTNLTATTIALGTGFSVSGTKIEDYDDGWLRCIVTVVMGTTVSSPGAFFGLSDNSAFTVSGFPAYVAAGNVVAMWGGQLEAGAFATSYIPTEATAVTRNADVATMTGTNFSDWYGDGTNETWFAQVIYANRRDGDRFIGLDSGTGGASANRAAMICQFNTLRLDDGTATRNAGGTIFSAPALRKFAIGYSGVTSSGSINGVLGAGAAFDGDINASGTLGIGQYAGAALGYMNGHFQKLSYYPHRLTDAEIQAITK